jgi:hypothetical protein
MNDPATAEIDLENLMNQIREEVARRRSHAEARAEASAPDAITFVNDSPSGSSEPVQEGTHGVAAAELVKTPKAPIEGVPICLDDFAHLDGRSLVEAAYQALLHRTPDPTGMEFCLLRLRSGATRAEIFGRLRYSLEGRAINVRVPGLAWAYRFDRLTHWPILGWAFRFLGALWGLPGIRRDMRVVSDQMSRVALQSEDQARAATRAFSERLGDVERRLTLLSDAIQKSVAGLRDAIESLSKDRVDRDSVVMEMRSRATGNDFQALQLELLALANSVAGLRRSPGDRDELTSQEQAQATAGAIVALKAELVVLSNSVAGLQRSKADRDDETFRNQAHATAAAIESLKIDLATIREKAVGFPSLVDFETLTSELAAVTGAIKNLESSKADRSELASQIETRSAITDIAPLMERLASLDGSIESLKQSKVDHARIEQIGSDTRHLLHRAVDDVNRTFRMLLDSKADRVELDNARREFESAASGIQRALCEVAQSIEETRTASATVDGVRKELHSALRAGLDGLTQALSALASSKADRTTLGAFGEGAGKALSQSSKKEKVIRKSGGGKGPKVLGKG